jgi:hypothetical protein
MLLAGLRRLAIIAGAVVGGTVCVSALLAVAAGADVLRGVSVGLYVLGAVLLVGCFVFGARGPLRGMGRAGETVPMMGARGVRRATEDERSEATRTAILLFVLGLVVIFLGSLLDPAHSTF